MTTDKLPFPSHLPPISIPKPGLKWVFRGENYDEARSVSPGHLARFIVSEWVLNRVPWRACSNGYPCAELVPIESPAKKRIPLTAEDIPAVCWVRFRVESPNVLIHSIDSCGVSYAGKEREQEVTFQELMRDGWEYSQDRRNWKPCYKEIEE